MRIFFPREDGLMRVKDIMTHNVVSVSPETTAAEAAQLMERHNVGCIPVVENNLLAGILTDRDIVLRAVAQGYDPAKVPVKDIMTRNVHSISPEATVEEATDIMSTHQVRRLPVVRENRLVGMLSLGDISVNQDYDYEVSKALCDISMPSGPQNLRKR